MQTEADDQTANALVRRVATRAEYPEGAFPTQQAAQLYQHVDWMRLELFERKLPEVVLSFQTTNRKTLGHYVLGRNALGLRWNVNLNRRHLGRGEDQVLATLLHELLHVWQETYGKPGKPPYHNAEFQERARALGTPTDLHGHYQEPLEGTPFHDYCRRHAVAWKVEPAKPKRGGGSQGGGNGGTGEEGDADDVLETPRTGGSKLKKWTCTCGVNVRVAIADFDATCNRCRTPFALAE